MNQWPSAAQAPPAPQGAPTPEPAQQPHSALPAETQTFLLNLYEYLYTRDLARVKSLYTYDFPRVSEALYANGTWPTVEEAAQFYATHNKKHQLILLLYQELWFRHFFANAAPEAVSWHHRLESWRNYTVLLDFFACSQCSDDPNTTRLALPPQWIWDMLESFCDRFHECQQAKWKLLESGGTAGRAEDELASLEELWNSKLVYSILHTFVSVSGIVRGLATKGLEVFNTSEWSIKAPIGYFACIALLKLNVASASYGNALESVRPLLSLQLWPDIPPTCRVTYYYNLALARFMGREYKLATKYACTLYVHNLKLREQLGGGGPYRRLAHKMVHQCANLLLLCHLIAPEVRIDNYILNGVKEHHKADAARLFSGNADEAAVCDVFRRCLPRMCSAAVWTPLMNPVMVPMQLEVEMIERQVTLFEAEYRTHLEHAQLLALTKLYHNVTFHKLAALSGLITPDMSPEQVQLQINRVRSQIMYLQSRYGHNGDVVCVVDNDIVHVTPKQSSEVLTEQFKRHSLKIQELIQQVKNVQLTSSGDAARPSPPAASTGNTTRNQLRPRA